VMNQADGDMSAKGRVVSTRAPDKNQKPGTSMLDDAEPMQAKADQMDTSHKSSQIRYAGHAVLWQGANRTSADAIDIDRNNKTLHATGNVVSELLDQKSSDDTEQKPAATVKLKPVVATSEEQAQSGKDAPVFTMVYAPEMLYSDTTRVARYTGGVKLLRNRMTVTSKELTAYLTPKTPENDDSSLDRAIANGSVTVHYVREDNRTRTGTGDQCEYSAKEDKAILTGGDPTMVDSFKGVTRGTKLTYFNQDDHLLVDGGSKQAFTEMRKKNK
jgi:lipopolysaccharide transport protein LptA